MNITYDLIDGINVRDDKNINYAKLICSGDKIIETRNSNSLKPYIGKRVRIIRTGIKNSKAMIVGECTIGSPFIYNSEEEFINDYDKHLVPYDSIYFITEIKYAYPIIDPVLYDTPYEAVGLGIVCRKNQPYTSD